ncbi:uncharacterized protein LOC102702485 isoform X2 [Oryza brachyantha]|uniref:uncharacterized protein LOC102702485 isoform X2 n=1 Tax=Oryza brachyantha TaxID=4533 RepID=UPI0007761F7D|nr:uncharacterized protein LOC102702485 isoform X2 [Oryza brachyantha]
MAAVRPAWSPPHLAVGAASTSLSPRAGTPSFLPLASRHGRTLPAPVRRIRFRSRCLKSPSQPEPGREHEDDNAGDEDVAASIHKMIHKFQEEFRAALGLRTPADMFLKEKSQISVIERKLYSSRSNVLNSNVKAVAFTVCRQAILALDLASEVMDVAAFGLGRSEISQCTTDQMVRTYAAIFCEASKDAYHNRGKKESILTFLDALGCLGSITHILVQDTVDKLPEGTFKDEITRDLHALRHVFNKKMKKLAEDFTEATRIDGDEVHIFLS